MFFIVNSPFAQAGFVAADSPKCLEINYKCMFSSNVLQHDLIICVAALTFFKMTIKQPRSEQLNQEVLQN